MIAQHEESTRRPSPGTSICIRAYAWELVQGGYMASTIQQRNYYEVLQYKNARAAALSSPSEMAHMPAVHELSEEEKKITHTTTKHFFFSQARGAYTTLSITNLMQVDLYIPYQ
jgi:hypothetical protein